MHLHCQNTTIVFLMFVTRGHSWVMEINPPHDSYVWGSWCPVGVTILRRSGHIRRRHTARGKGCVGISDQPLACLISSTITWRNPSTTCSLWPRAQADMDQFLQNQEPKHLPSSGILGTSNRVTQQTETTETAYFLPNSASFSLTGLEHLWQRAVSSLLTNICCPMPPGSSTSRHHHFINSINS